MPTAILPQFRWLGESMADSGFGHETVELQQLTTEARRTRRFTEKDNNNFLEEPRSPPESMCGALSLN